MATFPRVHRGSIVRGRPIVPVIPAPAQPLSLPLEILDLIIDELAPLHTYRSHWPCHSAWRPADLLSCCLVAKAFLAAARPRLYYKVAILVEARDQYRGLDEEEEAELSGRDEEELLTTNSWRLELTLICAPHLAALVQHVEVVYYRAGLGLVPFAQSPAIALAVILRTCPNVRRVEITLPLYGGGEGLQEEEVLPLVSTLAIAGNSIRELVFTNVEHRSALASSAIASLLAALPELASLKVKGGLFFGPRAAGGPTKLMSLAISTLEHDATVDVSHIPRSDFLLLACSSALSLRSLTLTTTRDIGDLILPTFLNLDRLSWTHCGGWYRTVVEAVETETRVALRARNTLSTLSLRHLTLDFPDDLVDILDNLDFLPPTLETLRIPPPSPEVLLRFLDSGRCASLKQIELIEGDGHDIQAERYERWDAWNPWTVAKVLAAYRRRRLRVWLPLGELVW